MWVAIVGSRTLGEDCGCVDGQPHPEDCPKLTAWLLILKSVTKAAAAPGFEGIVTGGARGADSMGEEAARMLGCSVKVYRPESEKGRTFAERAYKRNSRIVKQVAEAGTSPGMVLAFYDPRKLKSPGTGDTVSKALKAGLPVHIWHGRWEQ